MKPSYHACFSAGFATATYFSTQSLLLSAANFLAGVLWDLDHVPEYLLTTKTKPGVSKFLKEEMHLQAHKSVLLFHGFDFALLVFGILYFLVSPALAWAILIGALQHLLLDSIYNPINTPWAYFLSYRIFHGFDTDAAFYRLDTQTVWEKRKRRIFSGRGQ